MIGDGGPLSFLGIDGSPVAIVAGLVFFNASVVIRVVGGAWESLDPRPEEAAAALGASPRQVLRDVTLPALRPAIVSAATVVFLFCATAFGIVLTLGGLRYSSVETQIYLLTTNLLDLQAAAALSVLQLLVVRRSSWSRRPARDVRRTRRSPGLVRGPGRPRRGDTPGPRRDVRPARAGGRTDRVAGGGLAPRPRRLEPGQLPRAPDARLPPGAARAGHRRRRELPAHRRRRHLDVPAARPLRGDGRHPALAHPLGATPPRGARRPLHAAARGLGGDPRLRLPDHPGQPAARPARLAPADPDRPGAGRAPARRPGAGAGAVRRRRPAAPGRRDPRRLAGPRHARRRPAGDLEAAARRRRASRSPARSGSSAPRRSWCATTARPCRS